MTGRLAYKVLGKLY